MKTAFLVAATNSGCGKTTITSAILHLLANKRKLNVQPFKCGPDYIDPIYHFMATGKHSVNLDQWFADDTHLKSVFRDYSANADVSVVEGVMGLFDGFNKTNGSSAQLAAVLNLPVVLVVNAKSMAYSIAPLIKGFMQFNPVLNIVGVILNNVSSKHHETILRDACDDIGVKCFGCIPHIKYLEMPSRHLGLSLENSNVINGMIESAANVLSDCIDIDNLLNSCVIDDWNLMGDKKYNISDFNNSEVILNSNPSISNNIQNKLHIVVAYDEAFNFIYRENIDSLRKFADVSFFSPLKDNKLPKADIIYIPGGYPEFFLSQLSDNKSIINDLRDYINKGGKLFAECGGLMYLCKNIVSQDGVKYPMVGIFNQDATMQQMRLHLGYRMFELNGHLWKGHEFHYSSIVSDDMMNLTDTKQFNAKQQQVDTKIFKFKNCIATYTHLFWAENDFLSLFQ